MEKFATIVSTLLMPGDQDIRARAESCVASSPIFPHAEFSILPEAFHSINREQPEVRGFEVRDSGRVENRRIIL